MIAICAIFRNETLYFKEWIEFHVLQGISKFFLYQNNSTDNWEEVLSPYIQSGLVSLIEWPYSNPSQFLAYQHCLGNLQGKPNLWVAFIDCDEFLFSPTCPTAAEGLDALVSEHPDWGAIGVNWMCFGSGGQEEY